MVLFPSHPAIERRKKPEAPANPRVFLVEARARIPCDPYERLRRRQRRRRGRAHRTSIHTVRPPRARKTPASECGVIQSLPEGTARAAIRESSP